MPKTPDIPNRAYGVMSLYNRVVCASDINVLNKKKRLGRRDVVSLCFENGVAIATT